MDHENLKYKPFEISLQDSYVIITPLKYVARDALEVSDSAHHQFFESKNTELQSCLDNEAILIARYQERESRTKRLVCIERLSTTLYSAINGLVTSISIADSLPAYTSDGTSLLRESSSTLNDVDWWKPFVAVGMPSLDNTNTNICLELGKQPQSEPLIAMGPAPSFGDLMEEVQKTFYDFLYLSKASLVFFVKTTLPKVRQRLDEHEHRLSDYASFVLANLVPSLPDLDLKYKLAIPEFIRTDTPTSCTFSLSFSETNAIRGWLALCRELTPHQSPELVIAHHLPHIKSREYQLLVLLLIEVLALRTEKGSESPADDGESSPTDNLEPLILIDVLIDRLGILQSLDFLKNEDPLKTFCLEVIQPFYSGRIPAVVSSLHQKCVSHDFLTYDVPPTPHTASIRKSAVKKEIKSAKRTENSASLKRTKSAPASLLSDKRPAIKKRNLGREVSMSKRAPSFELSQVKVPVVKKATTFEEKRKLKNEQEKQERIQVGQTPAKSRTQGLTLPTSNPNIITQLSIARDSKASFMAIGETPTKDDVYLQGNIVETPGLASCTPTRKSNRVFQAPVDGVQDTPTGRSILFKLDSPSVPYQNTAAVQFGTIDASPVILQSRASHPTLKKSVTFGGFGDTSGKLISAKRELKNIFQSVDHEDDSYDETGRSLASHKNLFGSEIVARRRSLSTVHESQIAGDHSRTQEDTNQSTKGRSLQDELDWL